MTLPDPARRAGVCLALALTAACGTDAPPPAPPPPPTCLTWLGPPVVLTPPGLSSVEQPRIARAGDVLVLAWREVRGRALVLATFDDRLVARTEPRELLADVTSGPILDGDGDAALVAWTLGSVPRASFRPVEPDLAFATPPTDLSHADLPPTAAVDGAVDGDVVRLVTTHPSDANQPWVTWDPDAAPSHRTLPGEGVTLAGPARIDVAGDRVRVVAPASLDGTWHLLAFDPAAEAPAPVDLGALPGAPDALDVALADALWAVWEVDGDVRITRLDDDGAVTVEPLGTGRTPAVHARGDRAVAAWADGSTLRVHVPTPGCTATAATLDPDAVGSPDVVLWGDGEGVLVWEGTTRGVRVAWGRRFRLDDPAPAPAPETP